MEEMAEEHGGEEGLLAEVIKEKGASSPPGVNARLKEIKGDAEAADERKALNDYLALLEQAGRREESVEKRAGKPGRKGRGQIPEAHRGRNQAARGGRQMAGHDGRRRAGRTGPRLANAHRAHSPTGRTLRHPAAATHRRSGHARRPRGRTPQEDGSGMEVKPAQCGRLQADGGGRHPGGVGDQTR